MKVGELSKSMIWVTVPMQEMPVKASLRRLNGCSLLRPSERSEQTVGDEGARMRSLVDYIKFFHQRSGFIPSFREAVDSRPPAAYNSTDK